MSNGRRITIILFTIWAIAFVVMWKREWNNSAAQEASESQGTQAIAPATTSSGSLPHFIEIGGGTCEPCKLMAPVVARLREEQAGLLKVDFINEKTNPDVILEYEYKTIPALLLFDGEGNEIFHNEGFMSYDDLLAAWTKLGIKLNEPALGENTSSGIKDGLFTSLNHAMDGPPLLALFAALIWGIISILLSPCHLASLPLIIGFVSGQGTLSPRRSFGLSTLFSLGILISIILIATITGLLGRMLGDIGSWAGYLLAGVLVLVGLHLMDAIPSPWSAPGQVKMKRKGALASFTLGLIFGIALGPCTFAFMAAVMALYLQLVADGNTLFGIGILSAYALGHCGLIAVAGGSAGIVQRYLNWTQQSQGAQRLRQTCGFLVIAGGFYMLYISV